MPARHRLGGLHLNILTDGVYFQDAGAVFGVVPRILWERLGIELNTRHQMALGLNSLLVESQGKTVLIETGVGEKDRPLGQTERPGGLSLLDELAALDVSPDDVDVVINTHLHADQEGRRRLVADVSTRPLSDPTRRIRRLYAPERADARHVLRGECRASTRDRAVGAA
jgi:glyoxylase-like metal-dependent hydrolase (beta-lactamase superfamily II)